MNKWAIVLFSLTMVPGCARETPAPVPVVVSLRDQDAPVGSQVDVTSDQLAGLWYLRAGTGSWPASPQIRIAATANGLLITEGGRNLIFQSSGPGRFALDTDGSSSNARAELWIYWADFDRRTLAIGDPDGRYVAILDHAPTGGTDRLAAARDILDWYGYNTDRLFGDES